MMGWGIALGALVGFVGLAWLSVAAMPTLARRVVVGGRGRHAVLDGFRGLLAISVLLHHGLLLRHAARGLPASSLSPLDLFLGRGAVAFFFMTSAALFVGQMVRDDRPVSVAGFLAGRLCRIVPLYLCAVAGVVAIAVAEAGGIGHPGSLAAEVAQWLCFDFVARPDLNGIAGSADYLGTVWSLRYEWMLYAALPVLAFGYRWTGRIGIVHTGLAIAALAVHLFALFLAGALALWALRWLDRRHADAIVMVAAVAGIAVALWLVSEFASARAAPLLAPAFLMVLRGRSRLVTWLAARPMRFLGQISYGIYLFQGLLLLPLARHAGFVRFLLAGDAAGFLLLMAGMFVAVTALATMAHLLVERPLQTPAVVAEQWAALRRLVARGRPRDAVAAVPDLSPLPSAA